MGKIVMTDQIKHKAEELYKTGFLTVTDIAKRCGVSQGTMSDWILKQPWYRRKNISKGDKVLKNLGFGKMDPIKANSEARQNSFVIPWILPGMNEFVAAIASSRFQGNAMKRKTEQGIFACIRAAFPAGTSFDCKCHVEILFVEKDRRRDYDNIQTGTKFILDALQSAGVLMGDGQSYLDPSVYRFAVDAAYPRVEVTVVPHPGEAIPKKRSPLKKKQEKPSRLMSDSEIRCSYRDAKDKDAQIKILCELNLLSKTELLEILGVTR